MNIETPTTDMTDQDIRDAIEKAMADYPGLCADGMYRMPLGRRRRYGKPLVEQFPELQQQLTAALDEVRQALTYLDECKPHRTFTCGSSGLKHRAENQHLTGNWAPVRQYPLPITHQGYWPQSYVSNGSMICACIIRGILHCLIDDGPNCNLALQEPKPCRRPCCPHWLPAGTTKQICETCRAGVEPDTRAAPRLIPVPDAPLSAPTLRSQPKGIMDCAGINSVLSRKHWKTMLLHDNPECWKDPFLKRTLVEPHPQFPLPTGVQVPVWPWVLAKGLGINVNSVNSVLNKAWDEFDMVRIENLSEIGEHCAQVDAWACTLVDPDLPRTAWSWHFMSGSIRNQSGKWTSAQTYININTHPDQLVTDDSG